MCAKISQEVKTIIMKNGIVIPCYNEANRLDFNAFQNFINENEDYFICFVNDGSQDETLNQLIEFEKRNKAVQVYDLKDNVGKGEAVRKGTNYLLDYTDVQTVGYLDADLATGFDDYKRLHSVMRFSGKNAVFGSRKMNQDDTIERSAFRKLASFVIGLLVKMIIGIPIKDTQCGAKIFKRGTALYVFNNPFKSRWLFDVEVFIRLKNLFGKKVMHKIKEVALLKWEDVDGSKITLKDSLKFPIQLLEIGIDYKIKPQLSQMNLQLKSIAFGVKPAA